jgi:hypothetical protein
MTDKDVDREIYSAMQNGKPFKTYQKTILGKVYITALDPFSGSPVGYLLEGDPRNEDETTYFDVWSEKEDLFLRRMNKLQFESGNIIKKSRKEDVDVTRSYESFTDDELKEVISSPFLSLRKTLNQIETTAVLYRMITLATEMEKSEKLIGAIKARLSEVQSAPVEMA